MSLPKRPLRRDTLEVNRLLDAWGITNVEAARRLGVSERFIYQLRSGEAKATERVTRHIRLRRAVDEAMPYLDQDRRLPQTVYWKLEKAARV